MPRLALVAVVLGSLASCRGGGCARKPPDASNPLSLLPADTGMVTVIDVAKLRGAPIMANFGRGKQPPAMASLVRMRADLDRELAAYVEKTGFDPIRDIDTVIIATARRGQTGSGAIVRGRHLDEGRLAAQIQGLVRNNLQLDSIRRGAHVVWSKAGQPDTAAISINEGTVVLGSDGWAQRMADLADGVASQSSAASNPDLVRLLGAVSGHAIGGASLEPDEIGRLLLETGSRPSQIRDTTWTIDAGQRIVVTANAALGNPGDATAIAEQWRKRLTDPKIASLFRVRADGATIRLEADLDEDHLQTLALLATMVAGVPFFHMD